MYQLKFLKLSLVPKASCFVFHPQTEGSKLQRDLRAYLEAVKGDTHRPTKIVHTLHVHSSHT